jgi:hypothetical protein
MRPAGAPQAEAHPGPRLTSLRHDRRMRDDERTMPEVLGGNMSAAMRVVDTVQRLAGPWTPTVHRLSPGRPPPSQQQLRRRGRLLASARTRAGRGDLPQRLCALHPRVRRPAARSSASSTRIAPHPPSGLGLAYLAYRLVPLCSPEHPNALDIDRAERRRRLGVLPRGDLPQRVDRRRGQRHRPDRRGYPPGKTDALSGGSLLTLVGHGRRVSRQRVRGECRRLAGSPP